MFLHASSGGITFVDFVLWQTCVLYRFLAACSGANLGNVWKGTRAETSSGAVSIWLMLLWVCPWFKMVPVTVVSMYLLSFTLFCTWHSCESCWLETVCAVWVRKRPSALSVWKLCDKEVIIFKVQPAGWSNLQTIGPLLLGKPEAFTAGMKTFLCLNLYIYRNYIHKKLARVRYLASKGTLGLFVPGFRLISEQIMFEFQNGLIWQQCFLVK